MKFTLIKCPLNKYTFKIKNIRIWVENVCDGLTLNLFSGPTKLEIREVRNDLDPEVDADYHMDALDCMKQWNNPRFQTILLDPPYSYRKSMEMYGGRKASTFLQVKDYIPTILKKGGRVITFGYHSHSMGRSRGFIVDHIALFSHGGAIHDTIATVEIFKGVDK
jgi:hypothetical protein